MSEHFASIHVAARLTPAELIDLAWSTGEIRFYCNLITDGIADAAAGEYATKPDLTAVQAIRLLDTIADAASRAARAIEVGA